MKLVKESVEEILKPKTREEIDLLINNRIKELKNMNVKNAVHALSVEFGYGTLDTAMRLLEHVNIREKNNALEIIYRAYLNWTKKLK